MDVDIDIGDCTQSSDCAVKILRGNEVVFDGIVLKGQTKVTLPAQKGIGKVIYHLIIADEGTDVEVSFDAQ